MILDLRAFEEFPAKAVIQAGPGEISPFADSVIGVESAEIELAIQKSAEEFFCQGQVTALVNLECARCLVAFQSHLLASTDFIACSEEEAGKYRGGDNEEYVTFSRNELAVDLVEPVRQALVFALPMMPVCSENCKGLCQTCGTNLNEQSCDCRKETTDPRWDGLKGLDLK